MQNATVLRDVDAEIADAQARLAELDRLREVVTERLADLNRLRASASADGLAVSGAQLSAAPKSSSSAACSVGGKMCSRCAGRTAPRDAAATPLAATTVLRWRSDLGLCLADLARAA